ncbi:MAG: ATP-binding protein [Ottowia sp.]|uniref:sensor histidine kinase n=1 Tax=Ottowia sp. TaxID=1898956 RepID=UPI0039E22FC2
MIKLFTRHLYVRIWLAALAGVVVVVLAAAWAWRVAEEQRSVPLPREVTLSSVDQARVGRGTALRTSRPGEAAEFLITMEDGRRFTMEFGPRQDRRVPPPWLHPQTGIFWLLGMVGLATAVGLFPIVRRLTQRLEALQRGVQRWGEGDLSARVAEDGQDEVADLSRRFNAAAARIEQLMDRQAALLQSQKSLLANASHELRSPLARIRMALELMGPPRSPAAQGALPAEGAGPALGRPGGGLSGTAAGASARAEISRNIAELDQLVDEILLASRLDAREADLGTVEPVDLIGLLAEECARVGVELTLGPGTLEVVVPGVAKLLRRAVRNLLENALRHGGRTGRASEVAAELGTAGGQAVLHVDDRGPGVPPAQRERIFEPFYRLPGASEREGGVGLGLALVKSIAERHRGQVRCGNREGGGARFTLHLPLV